MVKYALQVVAFVTAINTLEYGACPLIPVLQDHTPLHYAKNPEILALLECMAEQQTNTQLFN